MSDPMTDPITCLNAALEGRSSTGQGVNKKGQGASFGTPPLGPSPTPARVQVPSESICWN